ncbi:b(0,+)-type amino acid transporter 1 isoform X2 [Anabrus simplex]|uniref:b(0,+)-type amino acid transporter 1 isoform X2 n=1 Tax=Anabrus simplex TaxID=316456 RepID=UPI0035A36366
MGIVADEKSDGLHSRAVTAGQAPEVEPCQEQPQKVQLKRELGLFSAVSLIVGVMIGSGIFVSPTSALERSGSVGLCLVVWAVCGGISLLGTITYINFVSVKLYVRVQNVFTVCKLLACLVVILGGIYELCIGNTENLNKGFEGSSASAKNLALAFYSGLWAYDGWSTVTVVTEEVKKPEKNIPLSIIIGVPLVTFVYFMMNVAYMTVLTIPEMIAAPAVAVVFGDRALGYVNFIIPLGVAISTFGCALSIQFSVTRLCFVAGQEGHMVEAFSYVHMRRLTPAPAVAMQGILTLVFIVIGEIEPLIDFASFLIWIFYGFAMVALIMMRRTKKNVHRPYKVPLLIPIFIIFVALFLSVVPMITDSSPRYFFAVGFILVGVAVYYFFVYRKIRPRIMDKFTFFTQVLLEVVPTDQSLD